MTPEQQFAEDVEVMRVHGFDYIEGRAEFERKGQPGGTQWVERPHFQHLDRWRARRADWQVEGPAGRWCGTGLYPNPLAALFEAEVERWGIPHDNP